MRLARCKCVSGSARSLRPRTSCFEEMDSQSLERLRGSDDGVVSMLAGVLLFFGFPQDTRCFSC